MKYFIYIAVVLYSHLAFAQGGQYSNRTARLHAEDEVIVVPEVGGNNHLWIFQPGMKIKIQVLRPKS